MNRDEFLARVRKAADLGRRYRVQTAPVTREMGYAEAGGDLVEQYVGEATKAGGRVTAVRGWSAARDALAQLLMQHEPRSALCWRSPTLDRFGLDAFLKEQRVERVDAETLAGFSSEAQRAKILATDVGITGVTYAVAETGSLLLAHSPAQPRVASLVTPVYVAIVEESQIVADLFDVFDRLGEDFGDTPPSNLTFVTGPSKTGDIESKLVTGVHGPGKWHILVVR